MNLITEHIRVKLELFEGPLDLLLHLIRTQHIDIAAIPISQITKQYLETIELMKELDLNIAGEYLVMAATLILIKSRMLLPPTPGFDEEENGEDLREKLVQQLKQYEIFKKAGTYLEHLGNNRKNYQSRPFTEENGKVSPEWVVEVSVIDLLKALREIIRRNAEIPVHLIRPNPVSVRQKMTVILQKLNSEGSLLFTDLFADCRRKQDIIGIFLAILELMRLQVIKARQRSVFSEIRLVSTKKNKKVRADG